MAIHDLPIENPLVDDETFEALLEQYGDGELDSGDTECAHCEGVATDHWQGLTVCDDCNPNLVALADVARIKEA